MFEAINWESMIYQIILFGFILLFILSFILIIFRLLLNSNKKNNQLSEIEKKLDKIIDMMDKEKKV